MTITYADGQDVRVGDTYRAGGKGGSDWVVQSIGVSVVVHLTTNSLCLLNIQVSGFGSPGRELVSRSEAEALAQLSKTTSAEPGLVHGRNGKGAEITAGTVRAGVLTRHLAYADFEAAVREVTDRDAPAAKVVTDGNSSRWDVWVSCGGIERKVMVPVGTSLDGIRGFVTLLCADLVRALGEKAVGK